MLRRELLARLSAGLGAALSLPLLIPGIAYILSPLRLRREQGGFETLTRLSELEVGKPRLFFIQQERRDAWVKYPREPVGSVWLIRQPKGANPPVVALSSECPHLGCAISLKDESKGFICHCHASAFDLSGKPENAAPPRPMDTLEVALGNDADPEIRVKFERFRTQSEEKIPLV